MIDPWFHIEKARRELLAGAVLLNADFTDEAGRNGYLAAFHAALALIALRTGKRIKTHSGTHSEFARIVMTEPAVDQTYVRFLSKSYLIKTWADYDGDVPISMEEASETLATATRLVGLIEGLLPPQP